MDNLGVIALFYLYTFWLVWYNSLMDNNNIKEKRNALVVKSNELIRNVRYTLSEQEQKLIIYLVSQIEKDDVDFKTIDINIREYCKVTGIKGTGGSVINHIKGSIKELSDKSWWINADREILFRWIDTVSITGETISIKLSESLIPYVLDLKENFTKYQAIEALVLRGKYTIRLFEVLKSYQWQGKLTIGLNDLRDIINCIDKYKDFKEFNRNVLKYGINEINSYTDLDITYKTLRRGKKVDKIEFTIKEKSNYDSMINLFKSQSNRLDS